MFWAITCEAGKRYSQIPADPFHVSMAALEPREKLPENKQVSLMIEHSGKEFLLCTLDYEKHMQVNLDLQFNKGEEMFFFVNGEGTIHLSGYLDVEQDSTNQAINCVNSAPCDEYQAAITDVKEEDEELGTQRLLKLDDSDEDDSEDYEPDEEVDPQRVLRSNRRVNFSNDDYFLGNLNDLDYSDDDDELPELEEEESESESDDDDDDDDEDDDESEASSDLSSEEISEEGKRKKLEMPGPSSKRPKSSTSAQNINSLNSSSKKKKKLCEGNSFSTDVSMETHPNTSIRNEEDLNSSIGRTPMPSKKLGFLKTPSSQPQDSFSSPVFRSSSKTSAKKSEDAQPGSSSKAENNLKSAEKKTKVLAHGVEIKDLRVGHGPIAKKGKFVHVYYVGKLENDVVFDSAKPGVDKPLSFRLGRNEVIKGWDIGLEGMRVGGKRFVKVPSEMGYGKKGSGPIPSNSTLLFTVELKAVTT